jgi:limonene-1,2-epoxide hydrolase
VSGREAIGRLLAAIESRDLRAIEDALTPDATWQNVPSPAATGRDAVLALLAPIVTWSDQVRWDVTTAAYEGGRGWLERVDRFVIAGEELAVRCNGVFEVRDGRVATVRDYVDLAEWRGRAAPVLDALRRRPATDVVRRHLDAVRRGDPVAMAADYALDAELVRGATTYRGWRRIAEYFDTVPARLAGRRPELGAAEPDGEGRVTVRWSIAGAASGRDVYDVAGGRIVRQTVELDGADF